MANYFYLNINKIGLKYFALAFFVILIIILTLLNFSSYLFHSKNNVLGLQVEDKKVQFIEQFLQKNPDYIPGWVEIGRMDKVRELDPNYF
jgi:hypothetical protein